jgi:hypothetical protein
MARSANRLPSSTGISPVAATPAVLSIFRLDSSANVSSSGGATNSTTVLEATTRSCSGAPIPLRTAASASAPRDTSFDAIGSNRPPAGVSRMVLPVRLISWSSNCWRSALNAWETAGSLTPSVSAAAFTEPSLATSTNVLNWVSVTEPDASGIRSRPCRLDKRSVNGGALTGRDVFSMGS